ncbi:MAG: cupin domain-containing protein [Candidatus Cloacimonetes bacterium]|nr:cupin domain-containing protein [Candidatus Cloacimonadota bacterium]
MRHWRCQVCGHIFRGTESPDVCPHCSAPQEMFHAITDENEHAHLSTHQKVEHSDKIEIRPFFGNFDHLAPYMYTMPAGAKINPQKHPYEEMLYVIKGCINLHIGKHQFVANAGDALQIKKEVIHFIENIGNESSIILAVKGSKNK